MTVQEALQNIDIIVSNVQMKRGEHAALQESISLIVQRCKRADELEKQNEGDKESVKTLTTIEAAEAKIREEKTK